MGASWPRASLCIIIDGPHCIHQIISCCLWLQVFSNQYRRSYILFQNSTCFLPKLVTTFLNTQIKRGIETSIYVFIFCWFIRRCSRYFWPSIHKDIFNVSCYLQVLKSNEYVFIYPAINILLASNQYFYSKNDLVVSCKKIIVS